MTEPDDRPEFSVCQFFPDETYEYVRRYVRGGEAVDAFIKYTTSVGARIGTTRRVILTDGGDCINMEWIYGKGNTFPPEAVGLVPRPDYEDILHGKGRAPGRRADST